MKNRSNDLRIKKFGGFLSKIFAYGDFMNITTKCMYTCTVHNVIE